MAQFYVEVKEEKKWIFPEIEADDANTASESALQQATGDPDLIEKFVSHVRALD